MAIMPMRRSSPGKVRAHVSSLPVVQPSSVWRRYARVSSMWRPHEVANDVGVPSVAVEDRGRVAVGRSAEHEPIRRDDFRPVHGGVVGG